MKKEIRNEINKITKKDFSSMQWLDDITFFCYIDISEKLMELLGGEQTLIHAEYWKDEDKFVYLKQSYEYAEKTKESLVCQHLNKLMLECAAEEMEVK
jgi:hypothetical protein